MSPSYETLNRVHRAVNYAIEWVSDQELFGKPEYWEDNANNPKGDCEEPSMRKYHALRAEGYDKECFKLGHCQVWNREAQRWEGHMTLIARDDKGDDWVLSNGVPNPISWRDGTFQWIQFYLIAEGRWEWFDKGGA